MNVEDNNDVEDDDADADADAVDIKFLRHLWLSCLGVEQVNA